MPRYSLGDRVKIVKHPTKDEFQGLQGAISGVRESHAPTTRGVAEQGVTPELGRQWKYDVSPDELPDTQVTDLEEQWLESL